MKRILRFAIPILLLTVGVYLALYLTGQDEEFSLLTLLAFLNRRVWTTIAGRIAFAFILVVVVFFVPKTRRRKIRSYVRLVRVRVNRMLNSVLSHVHSLWEIIPVGVRGPIIMVSAVITGGLLFLSIFFAPFIAHSPIGLLALRYLGGTAAGEGVKRLGPSIWTLFPKGFRTWNERHYRKLWRWTWRRALRDKKTRAMYRKERAEERSIEKETPVPPFKT